MNEEVKAKENYVRKYRKQPSGLLLTWLIVHLPDHARTQSTQGGIEPWMNQVEPVYVISLFDSWVVGEQSI